MFSPFFFLTSFSRSFVVFLLFSLYRFLFHRISILLCLFLVVSLFFSVSHFPFFIPTSAAANTSVEEIRERLTKYVDSVFPVIFYPGHLLLRLKDEIRRNHRYLMMFMLMEGELEGKKRLVNGIQLLTIQSALMFLLALLYDLQQPTGKFCCFVCLLPKTYLSNCSLIPSFSFLSLFPLCC
jgi:hypothetical protein